MKWQYIFLPLVLALGGSSVMTDVNITTPKAYQVFQRIETTGNIIIAGTINITGTYDVEGRFNGGSWQTIASSVTGPFTGTLTSQAQGQGTLDVRLVGRTEINSISYVGIGDVFIIAGQSNASGRGTNNQSYSHATLKAGLFGNDYTWKELSDPTDSITGQIDTVSQESSTPSGSAWPSLATVFMENQNVPVAFIPCAKGGTAITDWLPGADHQDRATLYGSMVYRALQVGGVRAVLWWQGERDAQEGMTRATYNGHLDTLANAISTDLGVKLMPARLQNSSGIMNVAEAEINNAILDAYNDNSNVLVGPYFSDMATDDSLHLKIDSKLQTVAGRWWQALQIAFYPVEQPAPVLATEINKFGFVYNNSGGVVITPGTSVIPGVSDVEGEWTQIASNSNIAQDIYGVAMLVHGGAVSGQQRNHLLDLGIDLAGGSSYTSIINNIVCGHSSSITTAVGGQWFYFPIQIKAGSSVAVRVQGSNATAGTVIVLAYFYGQPSHPELIRSGQYAETIGTITGSQGVAFTPGTGAKGSWTSLGTTTLTLWWWQVGVQVSNSALNKRTVYIDLAYGDASNKVLIISDMLVRSNNGEEISYPMVPGAVGEIPAGSELFIRGGSNLTPDATWNAVAVGIGD